METREGRGNPALRFSPADRTRNRPGSATWFEFAQEILRLFGSEVEVVPISTVEADRPAPRPAISVLDTSELRRILGSDLPPWQDALSRYLHEARDGPTRG